MLADITNILCWSGLFFSLFQIVHTAPYLWQPFLNSLEIHNDEDSELWQELQSAAALYQKTLHGACPGESGSVRATGRLSQKILF